MVCQYCDNPDRDSISHIIPEALAANGPTLDKGVCERDNHRINNEVENPVISKLSHIRNFIQLGDKRGKRAPLRAEARFGEKTMKFSLSDPEELEHKVFFFEDAKDSEGVQKKVTIISHDLEALQRYKEQYQIKHPDANFKHIPHESDKRWASVLVVLRSSRFRRPQVSANGCQNRFRMVDKEKTS